nr:GNAT family N-acetyltransferase [Nocardioides albus]
MGTDDIGWVWDLYRVTLHADHAAATGRTDDELYAAQLSALASGSVSALLDGGGARVGYIRVTDDGTDLTIRDIAIRPDQQDHGFGSAAIVLVAARAATSGQDLVLRVLHTNPRARRLYERLGFEVDEERGRSTQMRLRVARI